MARLFQGWRRSLLLTRRASPFPAFNNKHMSSEAAAKSKSPLESNVLRILRNEIVYQSQYAPSYQPVTKFGNFMVEDRPGEQWITLRGKAAEDENIKIEATMFDGSVLVPKSGNESIGEDVRLHISLLVDIWKGEESDQLEFVCSAWSDCLEIQKVYIFKRDGSPASPYMGPDIKNLKGQLRKGLYDFLKTRGVNDGLSVFLHEYMMNKDRIELIQWLQRLESFVGTY